MIFKKLPYYWISLNKARSWIMVFNCNMNAFSRLTFILNLYNKNMNLEMTIKKLGSVYKFRVGRATGNKHIFYFCLNTIKIKGITGSVYFDPTWHKCCLWWMNVLLCFLAHRSRRLEWAIVIAHRPSSSVRLSSVNFHIFDFFSRTAWWILMKLGMHEVLMVPYKCCCFSARSAQGRIQGGAKIGHRGSPSSRNFFFRLEGYSDKPNA